jgi:hypothetical protein
MNKKIESLVSQLQDAKKEQELHDSLQKELADQIEKTKSAMDEASASKAEVAQTFVAIAKLAYQVTLHCLSWRRDSGVLFHCNQRMVKVRPTIPRRFSELFQALKRDGRP